MTTPPTFPTTALSQEVGAVLDEARTRPVVLTHYRKPRYAIMSIEEYERLTEARVRQDGPRCRSAVMEELPHGELAAFVAAVDDDLAT